VDDDKPAELEVMGFNKDEISDLKVHGPGGCAECNRNGYRGRVGLYELMEVTETLAKVISAGVSEDDLRKTAIAEGMVTLRDAGLEKIRQGVTSLEEVLKTTTITKAAMPAYMANPEIEHYEPKEVIVMEGDRDKDFFKLVRGSLYVVKGGKKIAEIVQPGDYFGEMAAFTGEPRSASILAKRKSTIKRYPGDKLSEVITKYPEVAQLLFERLASRLQHTDDMLIKVLNERKKN